MATANADGLGRPERRVSSRLSDATPRSGTALSACAVGILREKKSALQPRGTTTQPIWLAAQNGFAECAALLANAAISQQKRIVDATNMAGKTPCSIAIEMGFPQVVGALVKAGADVRLASPVCYSIHDESGDRSSNFDPSPNFPVHHATDMAVRSYASKSCAACHKTAEDGRKLSR